MKSLLDIKKDALTCAQRHNASNEMKCIKEKLLEEINGDRNIYLQYKVECEKESGYESVSFSFSVAAFILSLVNLVQIFSGSAPTYSLAAEISELNLDGKLEVISSDSWFGIVLAIVVIGITIYATKGSIKQTIKHGKYVPMKVILQEIDEHWDDYFKKV